MSLTDAITCFPPIIEDVALAIADDAYPGLSRMRYHNMLDEFARPLFEPMRMLSDPKLRLERFRRHLCDELRLTGNRDDYYDPRNSYLNEVLERRLGIPISLAVVWMAVGRRVGLLVEGIGFPGHFLVRIGGPSGRYVDVFNEGRVLPPSELRRLAERYLRGQTDTGELLEPVSARSIAERMLFNLRAVYDARGDHSRAMVVCDRLFDLTANAYHRRDRGVHALALGAHEAALRDFEAYLSAEPEAPDATRIHQLLEDAANRTATFN